MRLFQIFWRAEGGRTGDIWAKAATPAQAVTEFRRALREHSILDRITITGIAEDKGTLSLQVVQ